MAVQQEGISTYSTAALAARDIFYEHFNDVNFYVEDRDQENLYHEIIGRLFPRLKLEQVFSLDGKQNVLAHCTDLQNRSRANRSVYILDKDFDDLLGIMVKRPNLIYLDKYCIENFLLEELAIIQIALEAEPRKHPGQVKRNLDYGNFISAALRCLYACFNYFLQSRKWI